MDIIIFVVLMSLSSLFAGSETALFSLRESQVRMMQKNKERSAHVIARLKNDPHRLLATLLSGNTIVNVTMGSLATMTAIEYSDSIGIGVATGIATIAVLLFGEIFPKSFAISHNKQVAQMVAYPILLCYLVFYPFASIFVLIEKWIKRATNPPTQGAVTEEEIRIMSDLGLEHGEIDRQERQMIDNIFNFDDIPVGSIMTKNQPLMKSFVISRSSKKRDILLRSLLGEEISSVDKNSRGSFLSNAPQRITSECSQQYKMRSCFETTLNQKGWKHAFHPQSLCHRYARDIFRKKCSGT